VEAKLASLKVSELCAAASVDPDLGVPVAPAYALDARLARKLPVKAHAAFVANDAGLAATVDAFDGDIGLAKVSAASPTAATTAVHLEFGSATPVDPNRISIPAPAIALATGLVGKTPYQAHAPHVATDALFGATAILALHTDTIGVAKGGSEDSEGDAATCNEDRF